ncbi:Putative aminopeptidase [uncultured archaeon]|nr:Putative aminopeptidase [uncultured archaeon]
MLKEIIVFITALIALFLILNPGARYVARSFYDQARLLLKSKDINYILSSKNTDKEIIDQLRLVPEVMAFGDEAGFLKTKAYSRYSALDRDVFFYTLSASKKDSFKSYLWNWPFIGSLPYKGFTRIEDARKEELELRELGYDTYIRESKAMSTLGFLPDPVITTMIDRNDPTELVNVIFHERTHQLFFKKDEVTFNENAAVLLGTLTSLEFFDKKFGPGSAQYKIQKKKLNDIIIFSEFIDNFYKELDALYSKNIPGREKISGHEAIFKKYAALFKTDIKPGLKVYFRSFDKKEINNSYLLSYYRYYGKVHVYIQVYGKLNNDMKKTMVFFSDVANKKGKSDQLL